MRWSVSLIVLMAGCAAPSFCPPSTVPEPIFGAPPACPIEPSYATAGRLPCPPDVSPLAAPPVQTAPRGFWQWLMSGETVTGAPRDLGLDRVMFDTISSSEPLPSREPVASPIRVPANSWVYPPGR